MAKLVLTKLPKALEAQRLGRQAERNDVAYRQGQREAAARDRAHEADRMAQAGQRAAAMARDPSLLPAPAQRALREGKPVFVVAGQGALQVAAPPVVRDAAESGKSNHRTGAARDSSDGGPRRDGGKSTWGKW